jgi:hypothetical protein
MEDRLMKDTGHTNTPGRRARWLAVAIAGVAALTMSDVRAQQPAAAAPAQGGQAPQARVFGSDAGMVLNFIKADKTAEFEAIVAKLKEALAKSDKPERKQQAASWKVFRAVEPGANGSVLYVFDVDPAVRGADYTVSNILAEAFPDEVQTLYQRYADAYASGQNFVNLTLVAALGQ